MADTGAFTEDDEVSAPPVKKRRFRKDDWPKIEKFITSELDKRKNSQYRKDHETIWTEIDRQLKMKPMARVTETGQAMPPTWNNVFELGELSKVSEVIAADVRRIIFPMDRTWFESHVELPKEPTQQGPQDPKAQKAADGVLRSFMGQQHADFGFKASFDKSIKEALHHGSFVAEVDFSKQMMVYDGSKIAMIGAPTWVAHSMWNCYPDESPSVEATAMFYTGSMIIRKFMPLYKLKQMTSEGWMPGQYDKIKKRDTKNGDVETSDVELIVYYGDINVDRKDGDIYLPNSKAITANGTIVYYAPNEMPYPSIVYGGYEKQDPRDPYFTSPLIKQSPIQKIATILANKYVDGVALRTEPPIVYDGTDPYMVQNDGPTIAPGVKTPTKGSTDFKEIIVGDPNFALSGLQMCLHQLQEGTGVNAVRSGVSNSDRQTATEVQKVAQGAEVRTIDFIDKLNANLRTFLYMQHEMNKKHCEKYSFYSAELGTPDFIRLTKKQIPKNVHFDIVGSKGVLGEEQRASRTAAVVGFASGNPLFAPLLLPEDILVEMFQDAGNKNPERFVRQGQAQIPAEVQQQMQQMGQALQQCQQALQQCQQELQQSKAGTQVKMAELAQKAKESEAELRLKAADLKMSEAELQLERARIQAEAKNNAAELLAQAEQARAALAFQQQELAENVRVDMAKIREHFAAEMLKVQAARERVEASPAKRGKVKIKKSAAGSYEVEET